MKVLKKTKDSVLIDTEKGFNVWVDVWKQDGEWVADWNKYIFFVDNDEDLKIRDFQQQIGSYEECASLAINMFDV